MSRTMVMYDRETQGGLHDPVTYDDSPADFLKGEIDEGGNDTPASIEYNERLKAMFVVWDFHTTYAFVDVTRAEYLAACAMFSLPAMSM